MVPTMSRPAVASLRTAVRRIALPAPALATQPALLTRVRFATKAKTPKGVTLLPTQDVFERSAQVMGLENRDTRVYYRCVEEWARAVKNGRTDDPNIIKKLKVSLQTFHEAAIFLQRTRILAYDYHNAVPTDPGHFLSVEHPWTSQMLRYASDLGHNASTIVYINLELECEAAEFRLANLPPAILSRLDSIIAANLWPDAIILGARLAERDGDDILAASLAARAVELADGTGISCAWLGRALLVQGRVQTRAGHTWRARQFFQEAVSRGSSTRAWAELVYDGKAPESLRRSRGGFVSEHSAFHKHACAKISREENELGVSALERGDKDRFMTHQFMAEEWLRLANIKKEDLE